MRALGVAFALLLSVPASAAVQVRSDPDGRVSVRADAPASEVLERLGAQTGMKVVYEGGAPRSRVSVAFEQRTPGEAVLLVLQGLGYDYLIRYDRSGSRPELLIVSGPSSSVLRPAPAAPAAPRRPVKPLEPEEDAEELEEEAEEPQEVTGVRVPDLRQRAQETPGATAQPAFGARPAPSYPVSPFAPASPGMPTVVTPPSPVPDGEEAAPDEDPNT